VAYLLLSRGWQFASGVFTVILLTRCLNGSERGVYQLFGSLIAMQMFVELGLPGIVVLMTSHEWSRLRFDAVGRVEGDVVALGRLSSLHRFVTRWFSVCAIVFLCGVSLDGYFEIGAEKPQVDWLSPWLALVAVNAAALFYVPKLSILEGCQQVGTINFYRLLQAVTGTLVVWASLLAGTGLWALVASSAVRWAWEFYLVEVRYRETFASLREHHEPLPTLLAYRDPDHRQLLQLLLLHSRGVQLSGGCGGRTIWDVMDDSDDALRGQSVLGTHSLPGVWGDGRSRRAYPTAATVVEDRTDFTGGVPVGGRGICGGRIRTPPDGPEASGEFSGSARDWAADRRTGTGADGRAVPDLGPAPQAGSLPDPEFAGVAADRGVGLGSGSTVRSHGDGLRLCPCGGMLVVPDEWLSRVAAWERVEP
jgi:hypothetical protein